jgi:hypothetical protein
VAATRERRPQRADGWTRNVNDRAIEITAKPITQFEGVPPIALLARAMRLETNFVGVDDDRLQVECAQCARHIKSRGSGLQSDWCAGCELVLMTHTRKGLRCRGQRPAADDSPGWVLDHEHGFATVNIEANVVGSHRAVLPVRRNVWGSRSDDPVAHREPYRGVGRAASRLHRYVFLARAATRG